MTNQQRNDDILEYTKQLAMNRPKYQPGDIVLMHDEISAHPVTVISVKENAYLDQHGYMVRSVIFPSMEALVIAEQFLRPLIRTKGEMQQLLRVVL